MKLRLISSISVALLALVGQPASAQGASAQGAATSSVPAAAAAPAVAPDYVIGPEDVLSIVFWKDKELSGDVVVRPDGKISLPLLNDLTAAGSTPAQLQADLVKAAAKFLEDPSVAVVVKTINSRKVFITGQVGKPGRYQIVGEMKVLHLIAEAGGLLEYADAKNIVIIRNENGAESRFAFNYKDVVKGKNPAQNISLKSGDTVVVP